MNTDESRLSDQLKSPISRRRVNQGMLWATPTILAATAVPAMAASLEPEKPIVMMNTVRLVDNAGFLGPDGNVYVWGFAGSGQYGNGVYTQSNAERMRQVNFGGMATDLTGTIYAYYAVAAGHVYYWGEMNYNSPIDATVGNARPRTVLLGEAPLGDIVAITSTEQAAAALSSTGQLYRMGRDKEYGGKGSFGSELVALPSGWASVKHVYGGYKNFFAESADGRWGYWGGTDLGEVPGNPGPTTVLTEIAALKPWFKGRTEAEEDAVANPDGADLVSVQGGIGFGLGVLSNGKVLTWGLNATCVAGRTTDAWGNNNGSWYARPGYAITEDGQPLSGILSSLTSYTGASLLDDKAQLWGYGKSDAITYEGFGTRPKVIKTAVVQYAVGQGFVMAVDASGDLYGQGYSGAAGKVLGPSSLSVMTKLQPIAPVYQYSPIPDPVGPVDNLGL